MEVLIDNDVLFKCMVSFLIRLHEKLGWDDLGALLGSMALIDGTPLDAAIADDWREAVRSTLQKTGPSKIQVGLTMGQGYLAVVYFLDVQFRNGICSLSELINTFRPVDSSCPTQLESTWNRALERAGRQGEKGAACFVVKDGVIHEVHSGPRKGS